MRLAINIFLLCFFTPLSWAGDYQIVYLATYPRSGNHWVRYLIEEATHIATSSVYCDIAPPGTNYPEHLKDPFPWGGFCPPNGYLGNCRYPEKGEVVVLKTHFPNFPNVEVTRYSKAIRIVRHPVDSFYSNYVLSYRKGIIEDKIPKHVLRACIDGFRQFHEFWNPDPYLLTLRYEDLFHHPKEILRQILDTVGYRVEESDIERAVAKFPPQGGLLKHLAHYDVEDLQLINNELGDLLEKFGYSIP